MKTWQKETRWSQGLFYRHVSGVSRTLEIVDIGKATINYLVNSGSSCFDIYDVEDVEIDGLMFICLKVNPVLPQPTLII
ncbi:hypothetical protein BSK56_11930 [Paenibacillus borealis]|uniref:Uncharacterized protein n=1 Tax=Paenibacillus borealis TaxID=160799 RepID=A0ABX3HEM7_PAEBO|nr:hypothetical protein BSK56_11930 [Paenibacillus borealis]